MVRPSEVSDERRRILKRNEAVFIARRYARTYSMNTKERRDRIRIWIERAEKWYPLSRIQRLGFIQLLGRDGIEDYGIKFQDEP